MTTDQQSRCEGGATESLLKFPDIYYIKAMGRNQDALLDRVMAIVQTHAPSVTPEAFQCRLSRDGNYVSVTCTLEAQSREQLDAIYRDLGADDSVIMAL